MKIVSRTEEPAMGTRQSPRLFFAHIPKTAGITMKTFFENNVDAGDSLVLEEDAAASVSRETLRQHAFISSHYSFEILQKLGVRPEQIAMLVREPVARFRSWLAHGRRSTHAQYHATCMQGTAVDVLRAPDSYAARQAHWLVRSFAAGPEYKDVPAREAIPALLDNVDIPGMVEEIDRFMQLVAYRLGWRAPELGWVFNQRPASDTNPTIESRAEEADVRRILEIDQYLYDLVCARFWQAYAAMLSAINPDGTTFDAAAARRVRVETAQTWLQAHHDRVLAATFAEPVTSVQLDSRSPIAGDGWWWREVPSDTVSYRWSGPGHDATLDLPPLAADRSYAMTVECVGVSGWKAWEGVSLTVNGHAVAVVRERSTPVQANRVLIRLRATLGPEHVGTALTRLVLHVPATFQPHAQSLREDSRDTFNYDLRHLGIALSSVVVRPTAPAVAPVLSLRRPQAPGDAARLLAGGSVIASAPRAVAQG